MHQRGVWSCVLVLVFLVGGCQPSSSPIVGQSHQSSCKAIREMALSDVELQIDGRDLTILHHDALTNCCLTTAMEVAIKVLTLMSLSASNQEKRVGASARAISP